MKLSVNTYDYQGFKDFSISKSMETIAGCFNFSFAEKWYGQSKNWRIMPQDRCTISLHDQNIITGYIDNLDVLFSSDKKDLRVMGRDLTADLVDCSCVLNTDEFNNVTLLEIVKAISKPFNINVTAKADIGDIFDIFKINQGETCFDAISRACGWRAILPISDSNGGIVLSRASDKTISTVLIEGVNCFLSFNAHFSFSERYSEYIIKSQDGEKIAVAYDKAVKRHRPLLIIADNGNNYDDLARFEASFRAAEGTEISVNVKGFLKNDGKVWDINELVYFESKTLGIKDDLLIKTVTLEKSDNGSITTLSLVRKDAFNKPVVIHSGNDFTGLPEGAIEIK